MCIKGLGTIDLCKNLRSKSRATVPLSVSLVNFINCRFIIENKIHQASILEIQEPRNFEIAAKIEGAAKLVKSAVAPFLAPLVSCVQCPWRPNKKALVKSSSTVPLSVIKNYD